MNTYSVRVVSGLLLTLGAAHAQAGDDIEGQSGTLNITGSLYETPCSIEMASLHQAVNLGVVSAGKLQRPGDQANSVAFQLRFQDCERPAGSVWNERTGNLTWSAYQPVLSVAFLAPADADDPRLIKVQGVTGMGLRLSDPLGRDVQLGTRGEPLFFAVGGSTETWKVQPTRTASPLSGGVFRAVVGFRLNYE